ncbi:MAG: tRNA uridine-5-carboxymethylaminomethyl(34) synthesis GTPase MnmE [Bacteroidales bacterium]|jgi:tRNA modification GTPase|nr:tRNA uridine-5-carboxymethylaminomethyl(34) synthesis GTPase MnmE [Bacteroidales bacterium]
MKFPQTSDTICALSTAPGTGAIAVIRLSGTKAFQVIRDIFQPADDKLDIQTAPSHTIHYGIIGTGATILDEVLVSLFRVPHSYTGEDVVEISCHGSVYIQQKIIELLLTHGLRLAGPGEFTLRAFINGKFDLSQAEAVADLIASHSGSAHELAIRQMRGNFSRKIKHLRQQLVEFTSLIELELDFSEEHLEFADRKNLYDLLVRIRTELEQLVDSFRFGNVIKNGIPVAIIGKPNVGKSTLLNAILNEEKAIVSEFPGTTRDAIEDTIIIAGYNFRFIDTAGLRAAEDAIETIGIERTWEKIHEATIILYVFDVTEQSFQDVMNATEEFKELATDKSKHLILIGNKTDKLQELPKGFKNFVEYETIFVSGKRRENIHLIADSLQKVVQNADISDRTIVSNTRHFEALQNALSAIISVDDGLQMKISPDLLTTDIRKALYHLGEITGEITTDEILGTIFSRFCIGK